LKGLKQKIDIFIRIKTYLTKKIVSPYDFNKKICQSNRVESLNNCFWVVLYDLHWYKVDLAKLAQVLR